MKGINLEEVCNPLNVDTIRTRCLNNAAFRRIRALAGAMSMIDTGTESLTMVAIFITLEDAACVGLEIGFLLRELNTLSVGETILTTRIREISRCGCVSSIVSGAMLRVLEGDRVDYVKCIYIYIFPWYVYLYWLQVMYV